MGGRSRDISNQAITASEDQLTDFNLQTQQAQQQVAAQRQAYENIQIKNPYEGMENVYEDLTVNQQQAQFEAQQGMQQRANIMQGLRGAAGASGIAGLAQTARASTLLGMDYGALAGAQAGQQQAFQNQQSAYAMEMDRIQANQQMWVEGATGLVGDIVDAVIPG